MAATLIDTLVDDAERDALLPVLERRARYLGDRARTLAERRPGDDAWQTTMARASLQLEAAEAMASLGHHDEARFALQLAASDYLALQMPFGAALQRAFAADRGSLASRANRLVARWTGQDVLESSTDAADTARDEALQARAMDSPQQWGYLAIAAALPAEGSTVPVEAITALESRLLDWLPVPFGRLRMPLADTIVVLRSTGEDADVDLRSQAVAIVVSQLATTLRAVRYARLDRHRWMRGFAPVPWFDVDLALLIVVAGGRASTPYGSLRDDIVYTTADDAKSYAMAFLDTVDALRGALPDPSRESGAYAAR